MAQHSEIVGIDFCIHSVGVHAPNMPNWSTASAWLNQAKLQDAHTGLVACEVPQPQLLPPAERRRVGTIVKLAIAAGLDALSAVPSVEPSQLHTVFTSSGGDGDNCHHLCQALAEPERIISPTKFTNSVHNAPSGYWGIALRAQPASTSLCAYDGSFTAGLLDAVTQSYCLQSPVLLVSYDAPYPSPLSHARHIEGNVAIALLLSASVDDQNNLPFIGRCKLVLCNDSISQLDNPRLENLRKHNPTGRALPFIMALAKQEHSVCVLDYLPNLSAKLEVNAP